MSRPALLLLTVLAAAAGGRAVAQPLYTTRVAGGFDQPTFATAAPGDPGTLYVLEQTGAVRAVTTATGAVAEAPFLNLTGVPGADFTAPPGSDNGLLGLAFSPAFRSNGYFYVDYTAANAGGNVSIRVDRFTYDFATGAVDVNSRQNLLDIPKPGQYHNGGWIGFSPKDGYLYVSVGDGDLDFSGGQNNAQDTASLLGKILRLDVNNTSPGLNYAIPATNPFVNTPGARGEVWALGLRNPWRASFDRKTGDLYIGDVGESSYEEINFQKAGSPGGANYGWKYFEGNLYYGPTVPANYVPPIYTYPHNGASASVTGGYVYRGDLLDDDGTPLDGTYFFGDYVTGQVWSFRYDGVSMTDFRDRTDQFKAAANGGTLGNITSFAEDGDGNLYVLDYQGDLFELQGLHAVPEPGALALGGVAALGLWLRHRRRRGRC